MRVTQVCAVGVVMGLSGCSDSSLAPEDLAGVYPFSQINGHAAGWYHPLAGVDCSAAFTTGSLTINADKTFRFDLDYTSRCYGGNGFDETGTILVTGNQARGVDRKLYLTGCGPVVVLNEGCPRWGLEVRPELPMVTVRFLGDAGLYWNDPVLTLGPRQQ